MLNDIKKNLLFFWFFPLMAIFCALLPAQAAETFFSPGNAENRFMITQTVSTEEIAEYSPAFTLPARRRSPDIPMQAPSGHDERAPVDLPGAAAPYTPPISRHTAQNIAIRAGLPTYVSAYFNPTAQIKSVSWSTAATSGIGGGVIGMGVEVYDQWGTENRLNRTRIAQTGGLLGAATLTGVVMGQATQKTVLVHSGILGSTNSQILSGFAGDAIGSAGAAAIYVAGAYALGWADAGDARVAIAKGATGSVILAAGKTAGMYTFFSVSGAGGTVAAMGPYAITYAAALGAMYITDWIFEEADKAEKAELLSQQIKYTERNNKN